MVTPGASSRPQRKFPLGLDDVAPERLNAAIQPISPDPDPGWTQTRMGEERAWIGSLEQIRGVVASPIFWEVAAILPNNDLSEVRDGRPQDYPDWFMFLIVSAAAIPGVSTVRAAVRMFSDPWLWAHLVDFIDQFVPKGFTKLADLDHRDAKHEARRRPRAGGAAPPPSLPPATSVSKVRQIGAARQRQIRSVPPQRHHMQYFFQKWRGRRRVAGGWVPVEPGDPWHGIRKKMIEAARAAAMRQAQAMGVLDPAMPFKFRIPDRAQYVGFDGVVFPMPDKRRSTACQDHLIGTGASVHGAKYTIASTRVDGQYGSRVILDFAHNGTDPDSDYTSEAAATQAMALRLAVLAEGGMKGIVVDSVIRGELLAALQRAGLTVVNHPHAYRNPEGGKARRYNPSRQDKSHLRATATHVDSSGAACDHALYFLNGCLVERIISADGTPTVRRVQVVDYEQRYSTSKSGNRVRREYLIAKVACTLGEDFTHRVALFHTDPTSTDPQANWGEVARVFAPDTPQFQYLYGARNDTESRHTNLKAAVRYMPADVAGQQLRLLGAMVTMNATAWQLHQQLHGQPNVLDLYDTA